MCLARKALAFALKPNRRPNETVLIFVVLSNNFARELIWETYQEKFEELKTRFGHSENLRTMTEYIMGFSTEQDAIRVDQYFKHHPFNEAKKEISQGTKCKLSSFNRNFYYVA